MLHHSQNPRDAYRRVELDARIEGSSGAKLAQICLEAIVQSLGHARIASARGDRIAAKDALSRALSVILGLDRALDTDNPIAGAMHEFYAGATAQIRHSIRQYDDAAMAQLTVDFTEILGAMAQA